MRWRRPLEGQLDAPVGQALAVEPVGEAEAAQQLDRRVLEHAGTDAVLDVVAVALLEHDAVDATRGQEVGQHEARRPGADDRDLGVCDAHQTAAGVAMVACSRRSSASSATVGRAIVSSSSATARSHPVAAAPARP